MKIAIVTGSLAPYASRVYTRLTQNGDLDLSVFQCAKVEPGRQWKMPEAQSFRVVSLPGLRKHRSDISHVYVNPAIVVQLARKRPDVIIVDSFSPTMIMAAVYAIVTRTPFGLAIEGARDLDPGEHSWPHAFARRFLAKRASFGICTSEGARDMMKHWGLPRERTVLAPHAGSWPAPERITDFDERPFDLLMCGTLNDRKNPMFLADVVDRLAAQGMTLRLRIVGDGELRDAFAARLAAAGVDVQFDGYLQADAIKAAYGSAKLLVFPTKADTWGLVANEALLCGTPVLASPHALSSRELVSAFDAGLVRELDVDAWVSAVQAMLASPQAWQAFRERRAEAMRWFSIERAISGLRQAFALARTKRNDTGPPAGAGNATRSNQMGA